LAGCARRRSAKRRVVASGTAGLVGRGDVRRSTAWSVGSGMAGTVFIIMTYMKQRVAWMGEARSGRHSGDWWRRVSQGVVEQGRCSTARSGSVVFGRAELGIDRYGRLGAGRQCPVRHGPVRSGLAGRAQIGVAWHSEAGSGWVRQAGLGKAWQGLAGYGLARQEWHSPVRCG
jgi:hypothetical protein